MDSKVFERLDIQQIRGFLQCGELEKASPKSYEQRISKAQEQINKRLKEIIHNEKEFIEAESEVNDYVSVCEDVYMEMGIKCGAILIMNLIKP